MEHQALLELLKDMSPEEKIGQLIQVPATMLGENDIITDPTGSIPMDDQTRGLIGSILGTVGSEKLIALKKEQMAMQPHHIPILPPRHRCTTIIFLPVAPISMDLKPLFVPDTSTKAVMPATPLAMA